MPPVLFTRDDQAIGSLVLNRPEAKNALNWEAMHLLNEHIRRVESEDKLHALIVSGKGDTFCAGGDIYELHQHLSRKEGRQLSALMGDTLDRLAAFPFPTFAAIEGIALGGGAELALACDFRVIASDARLALPQVRLGLCTAWGGTRRLIQLTGYPRALEMLLTGNSLSADGAEKIGLANRIAAQGKALQTTFELARRMTACGQPVLRSIKSIALSALNDPSEEYRSSERMQFEILWESDAHVEASKEFVSRKEGPGQQG